MRFYAYFLPHITYSSGGLISGLSGDTRQTLCSWPPDEWGGVCSCMQRCGFGCRSCLLRMTRRIFQSASFSCTFVRKHLL